MCEEFDKKLTDFFESFQDFEVCNIADLTYVVQVGFFTSLKKQIYSSYHKTQHGKNKHFIVTSLNWAQPQQYV